MGLYNYFAKTIPGACLEHGHDAGFIQLNLRFPPWGHVWISRVDGVGVWKSEGGGKRARGGIVPGRRKEQLY